MSVSTDIVGTVAPSDLDPVPTTEPAQAPLENVIECAKQPAPTFLHSPPDSNNAAKTDATDSELSDLEEEPILDQMLSLGDEAPDSKDDSHKLMKDEVEEDIGEVLPDHWSGAVAVFKPTWAQFKDFNRFMDKVDSYGMKSGIIKIIPPEEWKSKQPQLDDLVKQIKVREPIKQDIMGSNGTYRQVNLLHGRSYNLPQWRQLCDQSEHQPPARRGERRANADKPKPRSRPAAPKTADSSTPKKRGRGRPTKAKTKKHMPNDVDERPMTPVSPRPGVGDATEADGEEALHSIEQDQNMEVDDEPRPVGRMGGIKPAKPKTQSTSARRKYSRREGSVAIDEAAFKDFDYRMDITEYTPERCEELERAYWKTLTYAAPLYGADMMGTLFDDRTESWNLNSLPNVLDVLGSKIPGVNTAYLYLGMWKATFAWHLEDVDLYSINYLHFGAPKQWYSISQGDARRFELAMKSVWPVDAKACDQFLRHKAFLISPQHLLQHYGIKVNKVVSYPGEFVVTYPYGYHSGYNLGYNCAEAVNFGLEQWLEMGKIAKKCECAQAQDSVWINVHEIERKLRGEETEYEETDEEDEDEDDLSGLPTPPGGSGVKFSDGARKRKRGPTDKGKKVRVKKVKLRLKTKAEPPCCLCPNDFIGMDLVPTDDGRKAHRVCALYIPETSIELVDGEEVVFDSSSVHKDRLGLKCLFCRSKRGACFQCSQNKCTRAYHASCAAAAGVFIEDQFVPVFGEDGKEYKDRAFEFSCRFHRAKRDKKVDGDALESNATLRTASAAVKVGEICQLQFLKGDIFAGLVVENRDDEQMFLVDVIPSGQRMEVEWKWLVVPDPSDYRLPKASANALPMPTSRIAKEKLNAKRQQGDKPRKDDIFAEGYTWAEFDSVESSNQNQVKVDFSKLDQIWYYLGKTSTDAKAQYTEDPAQPRHNPRGNYLDTLPKPAKPPKPPKPVKSASAARPLQPPSLGRFTGYNFSFSNYANYGQAILSAGLPRVDSAQTYQVAKPADAHFNAVRMFTPQTFSTQRSSSAPNQPSQGSDFTGQNGVYQGSNSQTSRQVSNWSQYTGSAAGRPLQQQPAAAAVQVMPSVKQTWQVDPSVSKKYPFFQVNHNRDSTKYRTPYAPGGGFTNGYEGDLRAHLMAKHNLSAISCSILSAHKNPSVSGPDSAAPQQTSSMSVSALPNTLGQQTDPSASIPHCANLVSHQPKADQFHTTKPSPASTAYKVGLSAAVNLSLQSIKPALQVPTKQSPVPLPANFLAAMTSSPSTPATLAKSSSLNPGTSDEAMKIAGSPTQFQTGTPPSIASKVDAEPTSKSPTPESSRLTPVPIPKLPGMLHRQVAVPLVTQHVNAETHNQVSSLPAEPQFSDSVNISSPLPANESTQELQDEAQIEDRVQDHCTTQPADARSNESHDFPDVSGSDSMDFVERMMKNLRRASLQGAAQN